MAVTIEELELKKAKLNEQMKVLIATADAEDGRDLTEDEQTEFDGADEAFKAVDRDIKNRKPRRRAGDGARRAAAAHDKPDGASRTRPEHHPASGRRARQHVDGPKGIGAGATSASSPTPSGSAAHGADRSAPDQRSRTPARPPTAARQSQADGGYAIPPDFRAAIVKKIMGGDSLLARTDQQTTTSNQITFPTDETTPWQTSGGILVSWDQEASAGTQSKPKLGENTVRAYKLRALVPVTEELLADAGALSNWLNSKVPDKMNFAITNAIINGTGVGQPQGLMGAGCKVTVSKESGRRPDTCSRRTS
jgi:HK97 family phage major capsid protein